MVWEDLTREGMPAVERLIGRQESLTLEFKANDARNPIFQDGTLNADGRKILAKEISAFANSAGGVIVFGVNCRSVGGIDQADKLIPIDNLPRAETSVRDAAAELLQPRHSGIDVVAIPTENPLAGFIAVNIPRSERRPHRSEAKGQKEYFKRSGGRSYPMEHYDIEDAFRRTTAPILALETSFERTMTIGSNEAKYNLNLALKNDGEVSAKSISLHIWERSGPVFSEDSYLNSNKVSVYKGRIIITATVDFVVHPGEVRNLHSYRFGVRRTADRAILLEQQLLTKDSIRFRYAIGAENMRLVEHVQKFTDDDIAPILMSFQG